MRKTPFVPGEIYHILNRGVDKRNIFNDAHDLDRFLQSIQVFNTVEPSGSIFEWQFGQKNNTPVQSDKLVRIISYCLNPNHYHLLLEEVSENGISEFMKRLGGGYTKYFNERNKRSGSLFQGRFKSIHVDSDLYLKNLSAYINLNNLVHKITSNLFRSSWAEYANNNNTKQKNQGNHICSKEIILDSFNSFSEYEIFARETVAWIIEYRDEAKGKLSEKNEDIREFFLE